MSKLRKAEVLMGEAMMDLKMGCFNKAVSSSYFAVRLLVENFLPDLMTTKDDKIANALQREVERREGIEKAREMKLTYLFLFNERKRADHRPDLFGEDEAREVLSKAEYMFGEVRRILGKQRS